MSKAAKDQRPIITMVSTAGTGYAYVKFVDRKSVV